MSCSHRSQASLLLDIDTARAAPQKTSRSAVFAGSKTAAAAPPALLNTLERLAWAVWGSGGGTVAQDAAAGHLAAIPPKGSWGWQLRIKSNRKWR